jgi:hypothetical protein
MPEIRQSRTINVPEEVSESRFADVARRAL